MISKVQERLGLVTACVPVAIHTGAVASVGCQGEARLADTFEAAVLVDTHPVETHVGGGTLVMV